MTVIRKDPIPKCRNICPCTLDGLAAVIWPNYCRYGVEIYPINQSINRWLIHWFTRHFRNSERKDTISIISEIILIPYFAYFDNNNEKNINHIVLDKK